MEIKDWFQFFSVIALIVGWFVNGYLNRRNEIAKKRLEFVLPTLKSFLKLWYMVQEANQSQSKLDVPEYKKLLVEIREDFQLYGRKDEIVLFENFLNYGIGKNLDPEKASETLEELIKIVRARIRSSLNIRPYEI